MKSVQTCFNSNMVRLKEALKSFDDVKVGFQFQYGTIKRHCQTCTPPLLTSFNSNMVRLKDIVKLVLLPF